ncbi:MAG: hypothetical protein WBC97_04610 [Gemmatimonadales bacterium]
MPSSLIPQHRIPWRHLVLFGWMPGPLKVLAYRVLRGYRIGKGVKLSLFSAVVGDDVQLDDHVEIGVLAVVQGRRIRIGRHSSIGTMSYLSCPVIEIGEDARIREQVFVGGPQLPESRFSLGSRTIILQSTNINPTKPVTIGDDTGIGGHCLIFTHGAWLNVLDGYPATYEPVTIGASVWLPWRVFLMPGANIGDGSVIGANSLVSGTIPPRSLAVGTPAKVIRSAPQFPPAMDAAARAAKVAEIMVEFDRYVIDCGTRIDPGTPRTYHRDRRSFRLHWRHTGMPLGHVSTGETLLSEEALRPDEVTALRKAGAHWLDLAGRTRSVSGSLLTEELATFIGRYGIRLPRDGRTSPD